MWSFYNTDNFADCIMANRGHDADTCGALQMIAGVYGHDAIPNHFKDNKP